MKNKKLITWVLIIAVAILASVAIIFPSALAFVGAKAYQGKVEAESGILGEPEEIVEAFYNEYLAYDGNPLVDKTYQFSIMLSDDFIAYLDDFTADGMLYDPILCAQDRPERILTGTAIISGDLATVPATSSFEGHHFDVKLRQVDGTWKIDMVECSID
jgi:hypothetical protein